MKPVLNWRMAELSLFQTNTLLHVHTLIPKTYTDTCMLSTHTRFSLANCLRFVEEMYVNYHKHLNLMMLVWWKLCFVKIQLNKHLTVYTILLSDPDLKNISQQKFLFPKI